MNIKSLILSCSILFFSICSLSQSSLPKLNSKSDFDKLSGYPLSNRYGQVSSIIVVYDLNKDVLYFVNSKRYKFHYDFCSTLVNTEIDLESFNSINYSDNPNRRYLLANLNYFQSLKSYVLEISPIDIMPLPMIIKLYESVLNSGCFKSDFHLLLNSSRLLSNKEMFPKHLSIITPSDIYQNLSFQALSKCQNYGTLKFIKDIEKEKNDIHPDDIIVIDKTPIYLPVVAGIIVAEFQTPLSHLTILGQNRRIPICAYKMAYNDSVLLKFNHQKVILAVNKDTFDIRLSTNTLQSNNSQKTNIPRADLSLHTLIDINDLGKSTIKYVGNKASNLGILNKLSLHANFKVPESAFAIPFYFYYQHVAKTEVKSLLMKLLNYTEIRNNKDSIEYYLSKIRNQIENTPIDSNLIKEVVSKITCSGQFTRMRFRSSTNAEDAEGFSGAGLYSSFTGTVNSTKKPIDMAIKKVWSSLWTYEAFQEREYYRIKHEDVYMGILVHRSFPNENVNGVAITKNLYRSNNDGFVINAQLGDEKVVSPKPGNSCDQFICYPDASNEIYENKKIIDIISLSNLNNGVLLMNENQVQNLANQLEYIKQYFFNQTHTNKSYLDFGLDLEFKLEGATNQLYIKQVRLYND